MKAYLTLILALVTGITLAACSTSAADLEPASPSSVESTTETEPVDEIAVVPAIQLEDSGPAPEITNDTWINTEIPLTLASQRGKVVLMEFWTFGCINCQRVTPYIKRWHSEYAGDHFQVITIHYPEFSYEKDYDNVLQATQENGITYPVALDNDGRTWRAYQQRFWPTTYLIDKDGHIRYKHIGEFNQHTAVGAQAAIEALLAETVEN